ncbi:MAG: hypothetical protein GXP47_08195 [Acidobacteria bacterium]|nr:hypothetical protein [Acidobacteriota bacterium]
MRMVFRRVGLVFLLVVAAAEAGAQCGPWTVIPSGAAQGVRAMVWAGDRFVAVGDGFFLSPDGRSWRQVPQYGLPPGGDAGISWSAVAWNGHQAVAVADRGGYNARAEVGAIAISSSGEHWNLVEPPLRDPLHAVAWGNGLWVAGGNSVFLWSDDGTTWHDGSVASGSWSMDVGSMVWTGMRWVAVGRDLFSGDGLIATSEDGVHWDVSAAAAPLFAVAGNGSRTVAVGRKLVLYSDDGLSWTPADPGQFDLDSIVWSGNRFVAAGQVVNDYDWTAGPNVVLDSPDGLRWEVLSYGNAEDGFPVTSLAAGPGVLVGSGGNRGVAVSRDGVEWAPVGAPVYAAGHNALQTASGRFLTLVPQLMRQSDVPFEDFRTSLAISTDGVHWQRHVIGPQGLRDVAWRQGRYVAVGPDHVMMSDDGVSWSPADGSLPVGIVLGEVAAGAPGFVLSGGRQLFFSTDGSSWQDVTPAGSPWGLPPRGLIWAGDRFIAAGTGSVATSPDGVQWTVSKGTWGFNGFFAFAGNGNRFVGIAGGGFLAWSGDGLTWNAVHNIPSGELFSVTWDGTKFVVAGAGFLLTSTDGVEWSSETVPDTPWYGGIAVLDGRTVVAGRGGSLLVRGCPGETLDDGAAFEMALPAMAHTEGRNGTFWRSDLVLHNPGNDAVRVNVWPLGPAGGSDGVATVSVVLTPGQAVMLQDLLPGLLDSDEPSGGAVLSADGPVTAASRTFTGDGDGTWGQNVPLVPSGSWVQAGQRVVLAGLAQDGATRTNLGLLNPGSSPLDVTVRFHGADGSVLGERTWTVPARGWRQIDLALEQAGAAPVSLAWAELDGNGDFVAYASVIDNATGDAVTVLPATATGADLVVPAAAHTTGYGGVLWRTDLDLVAAGDGPARYRLELLPASGAVVEGAERTLAAGHAERLADVVGAVFGSSGGGAVRVAVLEGQLAVGSRTYAVGASGSFGQAVPAMAVPGGGSVGELRVVGLSGSLSDQWGFRTAVGAVNLSDQAVRLAVELHAGDGAVIGSRQLDLAAHGWGQLDRVFRDLAATPVAGGYAVITSADGLQDILAYASVIDNRTGDPVFLRAVTTSAE